MPTPKLLPLLLLGLSLSCASPSLKDSCLSGVEVGANAGVIRGADYIDGYDGTTISGSSHYAGGHVTLHFDTSGIGCRAPEGDTDGSG